MSTVPMAGVDQVIAPGPHRAVDNRIFRAGYIARLQGPAEIAVPLHTPWIVTASFQLNTITFVR